MSTKIKILPDYVMKRIAAGEVVERPASVVKELLENSLDAGAGSVSLIIEGGGLDLIQVVDDGGGMSEEDALLCCQRHATSKIEKAEDLDAITSLGFRGEALASISSVARMEIITCREKDKEATHLFIESGRVQEVEKTAPRRGTIVTVKDLFHSVPARRKFLKTPSTELRHIVTAFRRIAIAFPEIEFELFIDDEKTFDLRREELRERIGALLSKEKADKLIPLKKSLGPIAIQGLMSQPGTAGRSRDNQMFFLNKRFITSRSLLHALYNGYGLRLAREEHPNFFLFIELDPARVDVNVHPTKAEVRFQDEKLVYDLVYKAVDEWLRTPASIPELEISESQARPRRFTRLMRPDVTDQGQLTLETGRSAMGNAAVLNFRSFEKEKPPFWQLHNKYILTQIKSGLTIIDQHVAHERILYEKALKARAGERAASQQLLFPQTLQLSPDEYRDLADLVPHLEKIGFSLKDFGKNTVVIEAVPVSVKNGQEKQVLSGMIDQIKEEHPEPNELLECVARAYACKAAVKAGDPLSAQEMASLVDQLFTTEDPYVCPHGRPIIITLPLEELDRKFGR